MRIGDYIEANIERAMAKRKPKTTSKLRKEAWKQFSLWYRQSEADGNGNVTCYTCGASHHWKEIHAGHAIPGRHNAVLFDQDIIRPQCYACNVGKRGNYQVFVPKLIWEHGESFGDAMAWWDGKLAASRLTVKFTRQDLLDKIEDYRGRLETLRRS